MNEVSALQPDLAVGEALRAVARDILAQARAALVDPAKFDTAAVHEFRRAMKRWRAFLRLLEPHIGEEARELRGEARELAGALGGARDAQSALDALADLEKHGLALSPRAVAGLRRRIEEIRRAAESALDADMRKQLRGTLERAGSVVEGWTLHELAFDDVIDSLVRGYRRARRRIPDDWAAADLAALHELRKGAVAYLHQMDIVAALGPLETRTAEAQLLRDRLGKQQDLSVLAGLAGPHQPLARSRSRLAEAIAARRAALVTAAKRPAARLFADRPRVLRRRLAAMWRASG